MNLVWSRRTVFSSFFNVWWKLDRKMNVSFHSLIWFDSWSKTILSIRFFVVSHQIKIRNIDNNALSLGGDRGMDFIRPILRYLMVEKPAAVPLLSLRVIANMFSHPEGKMTQLIYDSYKWLINLGSKLAIKHHGEIITRVRDTMPIQPKPPQKIAFATILLNFTIACREHRYHNPLLK